MSLSAAQLTTARTIAATFMPDTASVFLKGAINATTGYATNTPGAATSYACRVDRALSRRGGETEQHGAVESMTRYVLVLPWNAVIDERHQVTVGAVTYDVAEVSSGGSQAVETRCLVTRST